MSNEIRFAVMRKHDETARAIFMHSTDAGAYALHLNETSVRLTDAFGPASSLHLWCVYPWAVPKELFEVEGK